MRETPGNKAPIAAFAFLALLDITKHFKCISVSLLFFL